MELKPGNILWATESVVSQWLNLPSRGVVLNDTVIRLTAESVLRVANNRDEALDLTARIRDGADHFPTPLEIRRVHCKYHPPADGKEPEAIDLTEIMRGTPER